MELENTTFNFLTWKVLWSEEKLEKLQQTKRDSDRKQKNHLIANIFLNNHVNLCRWNVWLLRLWDLYHELTAGGSAAPLVVRRVVQLLVFRRRGGEDAGNHQDGGAGGETQRVDHDGRQDHPEQLEEKQRVRLEIKVLNRVKLRETSRAERTFSPPA